MNVTFALRLQPALCSAVTRDRGAPRDISKDGLCSSLSCASGEMSVPVPDREQLECEMTGTCAARGKSQLIMRSKTVEIAGPFPNSSSGGEGFGCRCETEKSCG